ncbi:Plasmodium vivax Vir protein, putative [Plasmodium ovale]|uniref:Plasmodium vivax Vir protein, putative n=1 Tax=Plasmodium ovale TaxID=36330 RepID=A0A1C3KIV4_PLAOA|nr:Plasmodium vivax Vir protein, putative [Plasmodium ovale]
MSSRISTAYDVASDYTKYKTELDFDKENYNPTYFNECDKFKNEYITDTTHDAPKICHVVMKFLNWLKQENKSCKDKGSKYLFYWLHDEVQKNNTTIGNTLLLYRELYKIYTDEEDYYDLNDYINQVDEHTSDKLVKLTRLYDLFKKYESEVRDLSLNTNCNNECVQIFPSYVDECRKGYDNEFCKELKNFREQYNFFIRNIRYCEGDEYILPPVENLDLVNIIIIPFSLILVASFILPLLYKFTPFGQWMHHIIEKKNKILDNINDDTNHLIHSYDMEHNNSKTHYYNIAYNLT